MHEQDLLAPLPLSDTGTRHHTIALLSRLPVPGSTQWTDCTQLLADLETEL